MANVLLQQRLYEKIVRDAHKIRVEHPILFSGPMVRAILDGRKTQTRRVVKPQHECCPYGQPGDRLWVRETWKPHNPGVRTETAVIYKADYALSEGPGPWRSSIFMPRWASRITLEVTGVRVGRLQEITNNDALSEGALFMEGDYIGSMTCDQARQAFQIGWDTINAKRAPWALNPWVWVIEFRRIKT